MRHGEVGNRGLAKQVVTLLALQLLLQPRHEGRPLVPGLFGRQTLGAATAEQRLAVIDEGLDRFRRQAGETHGD
ncbi:hypothetical protein D3C85_1164070 [compost metagenome]